MTKVSKINSTFISAKNMPPNPLISVNNRSAPAILFLFISKNKVFKKLSNFFTSNRILTF